MGAMQGGFEYVEIGFERIRQLERERELLLKRNLELATELDNVEKDKTIAKKLYNG